MISKYNSVNIKNDISLWLLTAAVNQHLILCVAQSVLPIHLRISIFTGFPRHARIPRAFRWKGPIRPCGTYGKTRGANCVSLYQSYLWFWWCSEHSIHSEHDSEIYELWCLGTSETLILKDLHTNKSWQLLSDSCSLICNIYRYRKG